MMLAYKFLAAGAIAPFTRVAWSVPTVDSPGTWMVADGPVRVGACGAHVCTAADLAHWLHDELWIVEVAGAQIFMPDGLVVERARLVRRVRGWDSDGATAFARACIAHAWEELATDPGPSSGFLDDAHALVNEGYLAMAAYAAAIAVARARATLPEAAYKAERAWQSAWLENAFVAGEAL